MITIKEVGSEAIPEIIAIAQKTWPKTYGHILSDEQLHYMLNLMYQPNKLQNAFENGSVFLMAYRNEDSSPIAFASFERYQEDTKTATCKLQKLYAIPESHRKGVGKLLLQSVTDLVKKEGAQKLILSVNRFNTALTFYLKMGFHVIERVDFHVGESYYMNDYVMKKDLK